VEFLDTGCCDLYEELQVKWITDYEGRVIIVYDISSLSTFHSAEQLLLLTKGILTNSLRQSPDAPPRTIALVGNKTDKCKVRAVPEEEGRQLARDYGAIFLETSAKYNTGIVEFLNCLLNQMGEEEPATVLKNLQKVGMPSDNRVSYCIAVEEKRDLEMGKSGHRNVPLPWLWWWVCGSRTK
jgi:Ras family